MMRSVSWLPLRQLRRAGTALRLPSVPPPAPWGPSQLGGCRALSETAGEAEKSKKKFGTDRVWMGKKMTAKFVSPGARRPVPPASAESRALFASLTAAGADPAVMAQRFVEHFSTEAREEATFAAVDAAAFRRLLCEACPEQAPHADAVFDALSCSGQTLGADELLTLLRAGMPMDAPEFEEMVWEEKFETIGKLDGDHAEIFELLNVVSATVREGPVSAVRTSMAKVREHCEPHFAMEIAMLQKCSTYEAWVCGYHAEIHSGFIDQIAIFEEDLEAQKASAVCDLASGYSIAYMKEWMLYHMVWVDGPCAYHLDQAGLA